MTISPSSQDQEQIRYKIPSETLRLFHQSSAPFRCIVGPVGSGKSSAASMEVGYYLPLLLRRRWGIPATRWAVIRNTYWELNNTTKRTIMDWFPGGEERKAENVYIIRHSGVEVEFLFRSCDRPEDIRKLKSLELTGYLADESIEIPTDIKRMLKNRVGRYPRKCPMRFGVEVTNPPDVEDDTYWMFDWSVAGMPPGPLPHKRALEGHVGFWQKPGENSENLRSGYYDDLRRDYRDDPDWVETYIEGKPGSVRKGRLVYPNFDKGVHVAVVGGGSEVGVSSGGDGGVSVVAPVIPYAGCGIVVGLDNSGNRPAAVALQMPNLLTVQVMKEWVTDRMSMGDFAQWVVADCNMLWPGCKSYTYYDDPAGHSTYSKAGGGFTSNADIMAEYGILTYPGEQNYNARIAVVDAALTRRDGFLVDPSCIRLINGFTHGYHYPEIGVGTGIYGDKPLKNKYADVHDALQYALTGIAGARGGKVILRKRRRGVSYRTV